VSDRQEEREPRKAPAGSGPRRRLVQIGGGVVVACAIVIAIVLAAASPNGGDASPKPARDVITSGGRPVDFPAQTAAIPARRTTKLAAAARTAGCRLAHPKVEGSSTPPAHVLGRVAYKTNPPTSGDHNPVWSSDGNYAGVRTPAPEHYVHSLEHGRIELQYKPGTPARTISQLKSVLKEPTKTDFGVNAGNGRFALLFENNTKMPYAVAATAWGHLLGCRSAGPRMFDAIRTFRTRYTLQAPEKITQAE
jgi:hypothetical protein